MDTKQSGMRAAALHAGHCNLRSVALRICVAAGLVAALAGCMGYVPGRQAYWDAKVKEMCEKDGGVRIFDRVRISKSDIDLLGRVNGKIAVPAKRHAHPKSPVFTENNVVHIREKNPSVWRSETVVIRRANQAVVARWTSYVRVGGDIPSYAHPSSFTCPDPTKITADLQQLFIVGGE